MQHMIKGLSLLNYLAERYCVFGIVKIAIQMTNSADKQFLDFGFILFIYCIEVAFDCDNKYSKQ